MQPNFEKVGVLLDPDEVSSLHSAYKEAREFIPGVPECLKGRENLTLPEPQDDGKVAIDGSLLRQAEASWVRAYGMVAQRLRREDIEYDAILASGNVSCNPRAADLEQQLTEDTAKATAYQGLLQTFRYNVEQSRAYIGRSSTSS